MGEPSTVVETEAPVCIGGLYRFHDDLRDEWLEVPIAVDLATAIRRMDDALARRESRRTRGHKEVNFTDVAGGRRRKEGGEVPTIEASVTDRLPTLTDKAGCFEGRRYSFDRLIGVNAIWTGPRPKTAKCPFCRGADLKLEEYCLRCDRSGRDAVIGKPSKLELSRMKDPVLHRDRGNLAGGTERVSLLPTPPSPPPSEDVPKPTRPMTPVEAHRAAHPRKRPARASS